MTTPLLLLVRRHETAIALVALALLALGVAQGAETYAAIEKRTFADADARWTERAAWAYDVPITRNSTHYPIGTVLPMGEPAYYHTLSQFVHVNFSWAAEEASDAEGAVDAELLLRIRAETKDGRRYWEVVRSLDRVQADAPRAALHGVIDMDAAHADMTRLMTEMPPGDGRVNWTVEAVVGYAFSHAGGDEAGRSLLRFPIEVSGPRFNLPAPTDLSTRNDHVTPRTYTVTTQAGVDGILRDLPTLALALAGVAGLAAVLAARSRLPETDAASARFLEELARHRDYVSVAAAGVDPSAFAQPMIEVEKLDDLVQAAADARTRVLLDAKRRIYYAPLPTMTYRYAAADASTPGPNPLSG